MVGRVDRINAESPESNYREDANSLLRSLSFEAKPHLSRGGLAGVEGMAALAFTGLRGGLVAFSFILLIVLSILSDSKYLG
jgi:hypothetical protein